MTTITEMTIESDSPPVFAEEAPRPTQAWFDSADHWSDSMAPARGFVAGTVLGSAFWAGVLALTHAL